MSTQAAVKEIVDKFTGTRFLRPMVVADDSPLPIQLDGTNTSVPARSLTGDLLEVGATGFAFWDPPLPPIAFVSSATTPTWTDLTYDAGYSAGTPGQLAYMKLGNVVYLRGGATRAAGYTAGTQFIVHTTALPADCRPAVENWRAGTFGTGIRSAVCEIRTDGFIRLGSWDTTVLAWVSASTSFPTI